MIPLKSFIRPLSTCRALTAAQSGRFKPSLKRNNPLTYEQAHKPHEIGERKGWTAMNTTSFPDFGLLKSEISIQDLFIRKFLQGTWHDLFVSEILVKRQANLIRVAGIVHRGIHPRKMYFLIGYSEELLSYWTQCPVRLELQTVEGKGDVVYKFV